MTTLQSWCNAHIILFTVATLGLYWALRMARRFRRFYQGPPPIPQGVHGATDGETDAVRHLRESWNRRHTASRKYVVVCDFVVGPEEDLDEVLARIDREDCIRDVERGMMGT